MAQDTILVPIDTSVNIDPKLIEEFHEEVARQMEMRQTVKEWIESNTGRNYIEYLDVIEKYGHLKIVKEVSLADEATWQPFPQNDYNYRNVMHWVLLEDGSAMGWNESPRSGWSFPRVGKKSVARNYKAA